MKKTVKLNGLNEDVRTYKGVPIRDYPKISTLIDMVTPSSFEDIINEEPFIKIEFCRHKNPEYYNDLTDGKRDFVVARGLSCSKEKEYDHYHYKEILRYLKNLKREHGNRRVIESDFKSDPPEFTLFW